MAPLVAEYTMSCIDTELLEHLPELFEHGSEAALDTYFVTLDYIAAAVLDTVADVAADGKELGNKNLLLLEEEGVVELGHMQSSPQWTLNTNTETQMW